MKAKDLETELRKKDKDVEVKEDTPASFRVFIYSQKQKFPITAFIDRKKTLKITKISDYPKQKGHYPICVVRVERLRIIEKTKKRQRNTNDTITKTNIKGKVNKKA